MLTLILLVFAFVLACIAAFIAGPPNTYSRLIAAALAFFFLALVLGDKIIAGHLGN